ncbi:hypothetical protein GWI33_019208 [Rhynchophorus ferrugineus]|uniref:Uncharacterized protein n=1 Tax=Rhynchophorus ferrugineus TaxID=354439 RepID=A0A834I5U9_RHYFE|nr:hypothetical protein GWI33_019208 [Rhynchophorus ferrugineus]
MRKRGGWGQCRAKKKSSVQPFVQLLPRYKFLATVPNESDKTKRSIFFYSRHGMEAAKFQIRPCVGGAARGEARSGPAGAPKPATLLSLNVLNKIQVGSHEREFINQKKGPKSF